MSNLTLLLFASPDILDKVKTPLTLAALIVIILYLLYKQLLSKIPRASATNLSPMLIRNLFVLALVATVLGFTGYILTATSVLDWTETITLRGQVYEQGDERAGIGSATVHLELNTIHLITTDSEGQFSFVLHKNDIGKTLSLWAEAPDYMPSQVKRVIVDSTIDKQNLTLRRSAGSAASHYDPSCLAGKWLEKPTGQHIWTFYLDQEVLHLRRGDGWARGEFRESLAEWKGSLKWGNGLVINDVLLSPEGNCRKINTNVDWWYQKLEQ
jgi:hypothetical protein